MSQNKFSQNGQKCVGGRGAEGAYSVGSRDLRSFEIRIRIGRTDSNSIR